MTRDYIITLQYYIYILLFRKNIAWQLRHYKAAVESLLPPPR